MLYLGIDLHSKQLTMNLRDQNGDVLLRRQVSTRGEEPQKFLNQIREQAGESGYIAIVEVCGFHDWLAELLPSVAAAKWFGCSPIPARVARRIVVTHKN